MLCDDVLFRRHQRQGEYCTLLDKVYTAGMACEMTFVSSVASSE